MLLVPVQSLRAGMKLARPALHPDRGDLLLLGEGQVLDSTTIANLSAHGVTFAWIAFPGLEELDASGSEKVAKGHIGLYQALNQSIDELEKRVLVNLNVQHYKRAVHHMLAQIIDAPEHDPLTHQLMMCGPRLSGHLANCSYLALLIGAHLAGYLRTQRRSLPADLAENTAQLGLGALLHDIGKINMPDDARQLNVLSPEAATRAYRLHAQAGYDEVREYVSPVAANVVLHHHQRFDGQGFPKIDRASASAPEALSGQKIHVFARITAVVDVFDHLLCPAGKPLPTIAALHQLRSERFAGWFDPVVVEALVRMVPAFMVGQVVRLSDGHDAVVIATHQDSPCRPTVKLLSGPMEQPGAKAQGRPIDLRMAPKVHVAEVDGVNIEPYLFTSEFEPDAMAA
jgi:HD-GYP domain-containing protein (c-di-GMP phosphodiesterase class II)